MSLAINEYERYGRQMIVPEIGLAKQLALKNSKVLVVGAGGLGCPALAYLGGAGVGTLGIIDPDRVEVSNLHRQILHHRVGQPKAESAAEFVRRMNPEVCVRVWVEPLTNVNALAIISQFDLVLDCTDTPISRYLINDACVLADKPLVSASALKTEGQLSVYHWGPRGPCYRCLFPTPPPPQLVGTCGDNGIIGPVVGIMGVSQAVEALKVIFRLGDAQLDHSEDTPPPFLSIYSMFNFPQWRQMKIRYRQSTCAVCGDQPTITDLQKVDYRQFCGSAHVTTTQFRLSPAEFSKREGVLLDVRSPAQAAVVSLPASVSVPLSELRKLSKDAFLARALPSLSGPAPSFRVYCHHGVDSQEAVAILRDWEIEAHDVVGGLQGLSRFDRSIPQY